jgi:hypothetical protein
MGRYIARPIEWTVAEGDNANRLPQFIVRFSLSQHWNGTDWEDVVADDLQITGYFFLAKTNGQLNTFTIDALKASLGWDGASFATLANGDWANTEVQITVEQEVYEGKMKTKVKYLNHRDSSPTGTPLGATDPQLIQSLDARFGAMLRATGGAAKPAASKPAPQQAPQQKVGPVEGAKREAWKEFCVKWSEHVGENPDDAHLKEEKWKELFAGEFKGRQQKDLSAAEWSGFAASIKQSYSVAHGLIPF